MEYAETAPGKSLASYVKCIWTLQHAETVPAPEKVLPDAHPELIIHYGDPFLILDTDGQLVRQPASFVFGPITRHITIGPSGTTGMIAIRFYPGGLAAFLPIPVRTLVNRYISLEALYGEEGKKLELDVREATDNKVRAQLIEDFLVRRLEECKPGKPLLPEAVLAQISDPDTPADVIRLSETLGIGRRSLERRFNAEIGISPKMLIRIIRFQNVFKILNQGKISSLTELTYEAGYFDQSHFHRDFKAFAGTSPKEHFKENALFTKLFTESL